MQILTISVKLKKRDNFTNYGVADIRVSLTRTFFIQMTAIDNLVANN
ncbi:hypothetical protein LDG_7220 [Legionella drancourtii LLAP12]|uniref:Uncharacterized protein n=1 Tax=Legionella drancourtii LLAP12 TaxID=658187 RepID=G9EPL8_9GAMM|nr:hypothetical protein LDG_7220 [Legionella drancourtii LLAP12]